MSTESKPDDIRVGIYRPCPFCGASITEADIRETHLGPYMSGPGALISVYINHHCGKVVISARGRDHESAAAEWNHRAPASEGGGT